jgi:hypothetical protein
VAVPQENQEIMLPTIKVLHVQTEQQSGLLLQAEEAIGFTLEVTETVQEIRTVQTEAKIAFVQKATEVVPETHTTQGVA